MTNYRDHSNTDLLADYAGARRELASVLADIRDCKRALGAQEARLALNVGGKNAEERKANLVLALDSDAEIGGIALNLERWERRKDELEAEVEIVSKFIQSQQWGIRLRLIELLERRGLGSEGLTTPVLDDEIEGEALTAAERGMSGGSLESSHYAGKRRPQPTYTYGDEDEIPF